MRAFFYPPSNDHDLGQASPTPDCPFSPSIQLRDAPPQSAPLDTIAAQKKAWRADCAKIRSQIPKEERVAADQQLYKGVTSLTAFAQANCILLYATHGSEPNTLPIALAALRSGKRIAYPRTDPISHSIAFFTVDSPDVLVPGLHGIMEPPGTALPVSPDEHTLCLVPGYAFDHLGFRLGYGGGYYDRFLAQAPSDPQVVPRKECTTPKDPTPSSKVWAISGFPGVTVGAVYDRLFFHSPLPHDSLDIRVSLIVTEKGVFPANEA